MNYSFSWKTSGNLITLGLVAASATIFTIPRCHWSWPAFHIGFFSGPVAAWVHDVHYVAFATFIFNYNGILSALLFEKDLSNFVIFFFNFVNMSFYIDIVTRKYRVETWD